MSSIGTLFHKGLRKSKKRNAAQENAMDQKTINRMTSTRRLKRVKVRMPEFKCLTDDKDGNGAQ
jgi:hypothetical protein